MRPSCSQRGRGAFQQVVKWYVMFFYVVNLIMLTIGILIYFRNARLERK